MKILTKDQVALAGRLYQARVTLAQIAEILEVSQGSASAAVTETGVERRGRGNYTSRQPEVDKGAMVEYSKDHTQIATIKEFKVGRLFLLKARKEAGLLEIKNSRIHTPKILLYDTVATLRSANFSYPEIGRVVRLSSARVRQIFLSKESKREASKAYSSNG